MADPVVMDGFEVNRPIRTRAATATRARAVLTTTAGAIWVLHITSKGLPSIGYHVGKNWALHIDKNNVPTILDRW